MFKIHSGKIDELLLQHLTLGRVESYMSYFPLEPEVFRLLKAWALARTELPERQYNVEQGQSILYLRRFGLVRIRPIPLILVSMHSSDRSTLEGNP